MGLLSYALDLPEHHRERKELLEDEKRQNDVADIHAQIVGIRASNKSQHEKDNMISDLHQNLNDIYQKPGAFQKDWHFLSGLVNRNKQPQETPRLAVEKQRGEFISGAPKAEVSLGKDQTFTMADGTKVTVPASITAMEALPDTHAPDRTNVEILPEGVGGKQGEQWLKNRAVARKQAAFDLGSEPETPEDAAQRKMDWITSLPPEKQSMAARLLGVRMNPSYKNVRNTETGEIGTIDVNEQAPAPGWVLTGTGGGVARSLGQGIGLLDAMQAMKNAGQQYQKPDGSMYTEEELSRLPVTMQLRPYSSPNGKVYYGLADQRQHTVTIGNVVYRMDETGDVDTSTPLGVAKTGSSRQVPGMAPGEVVSLTTTPITTGAQGAAAGAGAASHRHGAAATPPAAGVPTAAGQTPAAVPPPVAPHAPAHPAQGRQAATPGAPPQIGGIDPQPSPYVKGTMLSQGKTVQPVVSSMSVVGAQIFGDEAKPPLWSYAPMYDKPELGRALNRALTMNSLALPGIDAEPGLREVFETAIGVTGWSQEQINQAAVDSRTDVQRIGGDAAMQFLSRIMGLQEDLSALRTATRASAAAGSIKNLTRAAPIYNVSSGQDFRNQLSVTMATAAAALKGYPVINPAYVKWWERGASSAATGAGAQPQQRPIIQFSAKTQQYRYSTDGGATWQPGRPPNQ